MEEEKLLDLQELVILERENFVRFIFNGSWNSVVHRNNIDTKLLNYEQTVAVAATSGIDMETKDVIYKWSYIQAVFFTSTILTTIGKNKLSHFIYSGVHNKRAAHLFTEGRKIHEFTFIRHYITVSKTACW